MKKEWNVILVICLLFMISPAFAGRFVPQDIPILAGSDTIVLISGTVIAAEVVEIKEGKILYRQNASSPIAYISLTQVAQLKHADGKIDLFSEGKKILSEAEKQALSTQTADCTQAEADAEAKYNPVGPFILSLLGNVILGGLLGLIIPGIYSSSAPTDNDMKLPQDANPQYKDCYREKARKIRKGQVWLGYTVGSFISAVFWVYVLFL